MGSDEEDEQEEEMIGEDGPTNSERDLEDEIALAEKVNQMGKHMQSTKRTNKTKEGRIAFEYDGRTIYEWEQSLEECNIYITPPAGLPRELIDIRITYDHLVVGVKDTTPFIDEDIHSIVKPDESMWTYSDGVININLQKMKKGETWTAALKGRGGEHVDVFTQEGEKKKMMLERFQEEHPGFDFSGAEFNGNVPDATKFMGGIKHF